MAIRAMPVPLCIHSTVNAPGHTVAHGEFA